MCHKKFVTHKSTIRSTPLPVIAQLIICNNIWAQYFRTKISPLHFKMLSASEGEGFRPDLPPEALPLDPTVGTVPRRRLALPCSPWTSPFRFLFRHLCKRRHYYLWSHTPNNCCHRTIVFLWLSDESGTFGLLDFLLGSTDVRLSASSDSLSTSLDRTSLCPTIWSSLSISLIAWDRPRSGLAQLQKVRFPCGSGFALRPNLMDLTRCQLHCQWR